MVAQQINDPRRVAEQIEALSQMAKLNAAALEHAAGQQATIGSITNRTNMINTNLMQPAFTSPTPSVLAMVFWRDDVAEFDLSNSPEQAKKKPSPSGSPRGPRLLS